MIGDCSWKTSKIFHQVDGCEKKRLIADWSSIWNIHSLHCHFLFFSRKSSPRQWC